MAIQLLGYFSLDQSGRLTDSLTYHPWVNDAKGKKAKIPFLFFSVSGFSGGPLYFWGYLQILVIVYKLHL